MRKLEYRNPIQNIETGREARHTIDVTNEHGEVIGGAEIDYFSKPIPYYQITDIWVDHIKHGQGIGSEIMEKIEKILIDKGRAGFLVDAIWDTNPANGFYERRGWIPVPGNKKQYVFNLPKDVSVDKFIGVEYR